MEAGCVLGLLLALSDSSKAESDIQCRMQVVDLGGNPKEKERVWQVRRKSQCKGMLLDAVGPFSLGSLSRTM